MTRKRVRRETMDRDQIPLSRLSEQYLITCRSEGKTPATMRGYEEKLGRFVRWCDGDTLGDFSVELVREYISYLQAAPKYEGHPYNPSKGHMSMANVRNHVRMLKGFSSWLHRELYTEENILSRLMDMVAVEKAVKSKRLSPMDHVLTSRNGAYVRATSRKLQG